MLSAGACSVYISVTFEFFFFRKKPAKMSLYPSLEDLKVDKVIQVCVLLILNYFMTCPLVK